jgi:hypothetical protein
MADNLTTFMRQLSWKLGASTSWNPNGLSRPVMGLLYFYLVKVIYFPLPNCLQFLFMNTSEGLYWVTEATFMSEYANVIIIYMFLPCYSSHMKCLIWDIPICVSDHKHIFSLLYIRHPHLFTRSQVYIFVQCQSHTTALKFLYKTTI